MDDRLGLLPPYQSLRADIILHVTAVAHPIRLRHRTGHSLQSIALYRHAPVGQRIQGLQVHDLRAGIYRLVGLIYGLFIIPVLVCTAHTRVFQIVYALGIVALDGHTVALNGKDRHGQGDVHVGVLRIIAHVARVHVSKGQRLGGEFGPTAPGDEDGISLRQVDGGTAQIIVPAVVVVMAEQEYDVQSRLARLVQHVEEVVGVLPVPLGVGSHGVMQREMGQNEYGAVVVLRQLTVQVGLQPIGRVADPRLVVVVPHVVHFVDDKDTVMRRVVGTALRQSLSHHAVGIVVSL